MPRTRWKMARERIGCYVRTWDGARRRCVYAIFRGDHYFYFNSLSTTNKQNMPPYYSISYRLKQDVGSISLPVDHATPKLNHTCCMHQDRPRHGGIRNKMSDHEIKWRLKIKHVCELKNRKKTK